MAKCGWEKNEFGFRWLCPFYTFHSCIVFLVSHFRCSWCGCCCWCGHASASVGGGGAFCFRFHFHSNVLFSAGSFRFYSVRARGVAEGVRGRGGAGRGGGGGGGGGGGVGGLPFVWFFLFLRTQDARN